MGQCHSHGYGDCAQPQSSTDSHHIWKRFLSSANIFSIRNVSKARSTDFVNDTVKLINPTKPKNLHSSPFKMFMYLVLSLISLSILYLCIRTILRIRYQRNQKIEIDPELAEYNKKEAERDEENQKFLARAEKERKEQGLTDPVRFVGSMAFLNTKIHDIV